MPIFFKTKEDDLRFLAELSSEFCSTYNQVNGMTVPPADGGRWRALRASAPVLNEIVTAGSKILEIDILPELPNHYKQLAVIVVIGSIRDLFSYHERIESDEPSSNGAWKSCPGNPKKSDELKRFSARMMIQYAYGINYCLRKSSHDLGLDENNVELIAKIENASSRLAVRSEYIEDVSLFLSWIRNSKLLLFTDLKEGKVDTLKVDKGTARIILGTSLILRPLVDNWIPPVRA